MSNIVDVCNVSGGSFTHCEDSGGAFAEPTGLAFSPDETQVYVTNILYNPPYNAPSISLCPVDSSHHLNCSDSGWSYPIQDTDQPWDIVINADSSLAYISSISENVVQVCPVTTNGFTGCQDSGLGAIFNAPAGIALLK
jgi:DNA-binding beta-propeller fold protein YncE